MYGFNRMNIFNYTQLRVSVYKTFEACVEEKQVGTNYFILVLPVSIFNNKTRNKISVNFKFYNNVYKFSSFRGEKWGRKERGFDLSIDSKHSIRSTISSRRSKSIEEGRMFSYP